MIPQSVKSKVIISDVIPTGPKSASVAALDQYIVETPTNNGYDPYNSGPIVNPAQSGQPLEYGKVNWWKLLRNVVKLLPFGGPIDGILEDLGVWGKTSTLSAADAATVEAWLNQKFYPFLRINAGDAYSITQNGTVNTSNLITLNTLLSKLCIIKSYFSTHNISGTISEAAMQNIYEIVSGSCDAIAQEISIKVSNSGLSLSLAQVRANAGNYDFSLLIPGLMPVEFQCYNYVQSAIPTTPAVITQIPETIPTAVQPTTTVPAVAKENKNRPIMYAALAVIITLLATSGRGKKK